MSTPNPILTSLLTSTLRRQHLLSTTPGAQRLIPLAAFAAGDLLARHTGGGNVVEGLLCGDETGQRIVLNTPTPTADSDSEKHGSRNYGVVNASPSVDICHACAHHFLAGRSFSGGGGGSGGIASQLTTGTGLMYNDCIVPWSSMVASMSSSNPTKGRSKTTQLSTNPAPATVGAALSRIDPSNTRL